MLTTVAERIECAAFVRTVPNGNARYIILLPSDSIMLCWRPCFYSVSPPCAVKITAAWVSPNLIQIHLLRERPRIRL